MIENLDAAKRNSRRAIIFFRKAQNSLRREIMIEHDTIELLRECDAGIQMGIEAIDEVKEYASSPDLKRSLDEYLGEYASLQGEMQSLLNDYNDEGKDPNPLAEGMSWLKTKTTLAMKKSDSAIADLMTDGCNMGIKSLNKYLNQYKAADGKAKDLAKRLISLSERQIEGLKKYL